MRLRLEALYMTKSLVRRLFLKQQLYAFQMVELRSVIEQITEYNKFGQH
jgi:hypothetical protein